MMASLGASLRGQAAVVGNLTQLIQRMNNPVYDASTSNVMPRSFTLSTILEIINCCS
jgi:hypothetical protein